MPSTLRLFCHIGAPSAHAGTLTLHGGEDQPVALKVVSVAAVSEARKKKARRELKIMCTVSKQLAGYVVELLGYCESDTELTLVMGARGHVAAAMGAAPFEEERLPMREWVRCRHPS